MGQVNWFQVFVDILQAVISGIFVGVALYFLDERRSVRERRLSDFRVASNWSQSKPKMSLRDFDLTKTNLSGRNFVQAHLESATFEKAVIWGTDFSKANLRAANFKRTNLVGVIFKQAMIYRGDFSNATISRKTYPDIDYQPDFTSSVLHRAKFCNAKIHGALFKEANLESTDFTGANVQNCDFSEADLKDSTWKKVKHFDSCNWIGVKNANQSNFPPKLWEEIQAQNSAPRKKRKSGT
jgi:uncharacterized protein YjbI with pentapeptide repeats